MSKLKFHKNAGKAEIFVDVGNPKRTPFRIGNKLVFPDETQFDFIHDGDQFVATQGKDEKGKAVSPARIELEHARKLYHQYTPVQQTLPSPLTGLFGSGLIAPQHDPFAHLDALVQSNEELRVKVDQLHFAGTDEEPFLVRMQPEAKKPFDEGEDEFYDALVPDHIKVLSALYSVPWKRQGDIFGVQVPENIINHESFRETSRHSIMDTRHRASRIALIELDGINQPRRFAAGVTVLVKGKITAPDHVPQKWKGWHAVGQTQFLHNPQKAD